MRRKKLLIGVSVIALVVAGVGVALAPLAAEPEGEKDCGNVLPPLAGEAARSVAPEPAWTQPA